MDFRVVLTRTKEATRGQGTFGVLRVVDENGNTVYSCNTGELPDHQNKTGISRVMMDTYRCDWTVSKKFPNGTFELEDKHGREGVRIHIGNWCGDVALGWRSDVEGCILLGTAQEVRVCIKNFGRSQEGVFNSTVAFNEFNRIMGKRPFTLVITENFIS